MRALVLADYKRFELQDVPQPEPGPGEVLIRIRWCGICGSDVHGMDGSSGRRQPPIIMGHEASGVIAAMGPGVEGWQAGDRVTFDSTVHCGTCSYCKEDLVNLCESRRVLGVSCREYKQNGAFAEYVVVPERILYRVPEALSFEHAAMVEPVSIAVHAVRRAQLRPNDVIAVVGAGMIGLLIIQVLRAEGCESILAADIDRGRLQLARDFGANETVLVEDVNDAIPAESADVAFEVVGASSTLSMAVRAVRKGGRVVLVGNLAPTAEFPLQHAVTRELSIHGSCASAGEYPECLRLMESEAVNVAPLISATAPLGEGGQWFDRLYRKEPGLMKVLLQP